MSTTTKPRFEPKDPGETYPIGFDWSDVLDVGETIEPGATVTVTDTTGADPTPALLLDGPATVDSLLVKQVVRDGLHESNYKLRCEITTSSGRVLAAVSVLPVRTL